MTFKKEPAAIARNFRLVMVVLSTILPLRYLLNGKNWIDKYFYQPEFFFHYKYLPQLPPLPQPWMELIFWGMSLLPITWLKLSKSYFRLSVLIYFVCFFWIFTIDVTYYLNHYYLFLLLLFWLFLFPPLGSLSSLHSPPFISRSTLDPIRIQLSIVYFYGALCKLQTDWLIEGRPMLFWINDFPINFDPISTKFMALALSWGGFLFDLSAPIFLWMGQKKKFQSLTLFFFPVLIIFHLLTAVFFPIGMFPWIMILANTIFLPENYHLKFEKIIKQVFQFNYLSKQTKKIKKENKKRIEQIVPLNQIQKFSILLFLTWQLIWPARHFFLTKNLFLSELGFRFSWQIMILQKNAYVQWFIKSKKGVLNPIELPIKLTPFQKQMMKTQPDLILQAGVEASKRLRKPIFVSVLVSINGNKPIKMFKKESPVKITGETKLESLFD